VLKSNTKNFKLELSAQNIFRAGIYKDTVVLASNSGSLPIFEIPVTLRVNGNGIAVFDFAPNKYADTLFVTELNDLVVNYNVSDPENDELTFEFKQLEFRI